MKLKSIIKKIVKDVMIEVNWDEDRYLYRTPEGYDISAEDAIEVINDMGYEEILDMEVKSIDYNFGRMIFQL